MSFLSNYERWFIVMQSLAMRGQLVYYAVNFLKSCEKLVIAAFIYRDVFVLHKQKYTGTKY